MDTVIIVMLGRRGQRLEVKGSVMTPPHGKNTDCNVRAAHPNSFTETRAVSPLDKVGLSQTNRSRPVDKANVSVQPGFGDR